MDTRPKNFDAVAESRKWKEKTGALLASMSYEERKTCLEEAYRRYRKRLERFQGPKFHPSPSIRQ